MARKEQFVNDLTTTLNGTINATVNSVVLADATALPAEGDYRLICEDEVMLVTARSTNTVTVERGVDGTTGATHNDSENISPVLTANALDQMMDDVYGAVTGRYPYRLLDDSGVTLNASDFTWVNQGTATVADDDWGGITMTIPQTSADSMRILKVSAPSEPWTVTAHGLFGPGYQTGTAANSSYFGLCARESDTGKLHLIEARLDDYFRVRRYTNETTYSSEDALTYFFGVRTWLQIENNATNLKFRCSADGINFYEMYSVAKGTWLTSNGPDEIGFLWNSSGGEDGQLCHLWSWIVE
jgi:hypothetical protein